MVERKITILVENIIRGEEKITAMTLGYRKMGDQFTNVSRSMVSQASRQAKALDLAAKKNQFLSFWSDKLNVNTSRVNQIMGATGVTISKTGEVVDLAGREVQNLGRVMKKGELETRRFNMSLLSVMFAGMALQRSMGRLLRPAAENMGIFELWGDILSDVFAPIMEALMPIFEAIAEFADRMPKGLKIAIGALVLFLFVAGVTLALVGQLGLAIGGLAILFGKLTLTATTASGAVLTLGTSAAIAGTKAQFAFAPFLVIVYAIIAVVGLAILLFYRWDEISSNVGDAFDKIGQKARMMATTVVLFFGWMKDKLDSFFETSKEDGTLWDWIVEKWQAIGDWLSGIWKKIKEFFKGIWGSMMGWFKEKWNSLSDWFGGLLSGIGNFFKNMWTGMSTWFRDIISSIETFFKETWNSISTWLSDILTRIGNSFRDKWNSLKSWFFNILNNIWNFFKNMWTNLGTWISDKLDSISTLFSNVWNSIKETTRNVWDGIKNIIKGAINGIIWLINKLISAWNSLSFKVPKVSIFGKTFGGFTIGTPTIPEIPRLARGGIVTRPTLAMIGEGGPEAVVPLNKGMGNVINFSPTFNVTVSDKSEFESMIKFNNTRMVEDLRRLVQS